jgi:dienelactone hydrolase
MNKTFRLFAGAIAFLSLTSFAQTQSTPISTTIPLQGAGAFGRTLDMSAELFKPSGDGPFPVLVYAHGRSGTPQERSALRDIVPRQFLGFWLARGFAVVGVARPGYGRTGGTDKEIPGHTWDSSGRCSGDFNPERVAEAASTAIHATVNWVKQQSWTKQGSVVVAGNSVGGMTAIAVGAKSTDGVVAVINFAGGTGGNPSLAPARSCMPERLTEMFRKFGATTRTPNLWLYAENDQFWGTEAPQLWHAAYLKSGAQNSTFVVTAATQSQDGHELIFLGRPLWEAKVDEFLKTLGL